MSRTGKWAAKCLIGGGEKTRNQNTAKNCIPSVAEAKRPLHLSFTLRGKTLGGKTCTNFLLGKIPCLSVYADCHISCQSKKPFHKAAMTTSQDGGFTASAPEWMATANKDDDIEVKREPRGSSAIAVPPSEISRLRQQDSNLMSFSPSKMSAQTLDLFDQEESLGVPLQTAWTFWLDRPVHNASMAQYKASLKKIYTVSTVQGFWSVYHHIPDVWELKLRTYYHLMREEKEPLWEDPSLANGGVWRIKCPKRETDRVWKELLLAAIGEQFCDIVNDGDDVCGLSVSPREKDDLIQIWNIRSDGVENSKVLDKVHQLLPDVRFNAEFYKPHQTHSAFEGANRW